MTKILSKGKVIFPETNTESVFDNFNQSLTKRLNGTGNPILSHVGDSTSGGDNNHNSITGKLKKYIDNCGYTFRAYVRGGEGTDSMMAYLGCGPMSLAESITIPASGSVTFVPRSSLIDTNGKLKPFGSFSQFADNGAGVSIDKVVIGGVKGTIRANQATRMAGVVFYNSSGYIAASYGQDDYAENITGISINATKMRVCINAITASDVSNSTAHVSINGTTIDLIPHINVEGKYLNTSGALVEGEGFWSSEEIDISSIGTITNIYIDGLANSTSIEFTRDTDGEPVTVEKGAPVWCENYKLAKGGIITAYINNFKRTGIEIAEDWSQQTHKILDYGGNGLFIVGSTHYLSQSYTEEDAELVENRLRHEYGERYFSGYSYLRDCGCADLVRFGVMTQAEVDSAIANGDQTKPAWQRPFLNSVYGDFLHFNQYASYLIARKFIEIGVRLGYWPDGDKDFETLS